MAQKVLKTGNSIAVTIPSWFAKSIGIRIGDNVKVKFFPEQGKIIYFFEGTKQLLLSENFFKQKK